MYWLWATILQWVDFQQTISQSTGARHAHLEQMSFHRSRDCVTLGTRIQNILVGLKRLWCWRSVYTIRSRMDWKQLSCVTTLFGLLDFVGVNAYMFVIASVLEEDSAFPLLTHKWIRDVRTLSELFVGRRLHSKDHKLLLPWITNHKYFWLLKLALHCSRHLCCLHALRLFACSSFLRSLLAYSLASKVAVQVSSFFTA